jgi:hypothetical protein
MLPYTLTTNSLTVLINGIPKVVDRSHQNFQKIVEAVQLGDESLVIKLSDISTAINNYGSGKVRVIDGVCYYNKQPLENYGVDKLLEFMRDDLPVEPIIRFLENLLDNPSYRAVKELYKFLEVGGMPLTEDGHFLAYKKVRSNFMDIHSGTFDNSVGKVPEMPRNMVDEDSSRTCSNGLHVCSYDYLSHFGSSKDNRVVIVKINPRDVVSIPSDYNNTKMRLCRYEVIKDITDVYKGSDILKDTVLYTDTKKIHQIDSAHNFIAAYPDAVAAEKVTGVWQQNIHKCLRGERQTAGGFYWELK